MQTTRSHSNHGLNSVFQYIYCSSILSQAWLHHRPHSLFNLIINGQRRLQDFDWVSYDHQFRQKPAATSTLQWGTMDGTLWDLSRVNPYTRPFPGTTAFPSTTSNREKSIWLGWNKDPSEGCPHENCCYEHVCYRCINIPTITDNRHKTIHCPNKERKSTKPVTW